MNFTVTDALDMGDKPDTAGQRTLPNWKVAELLREVFATAQTEAAELRAEVERLRGPLQLFLRLMDDDSYDFGELCEEFVPIARAALTGGTPHE